MYSKKAKFLKRLFVLQILSAFVFNILFPPYAGAGEPMTQPCLSKVYKELIALNPADIVGRDARNQAEVSLKGFAESPMWKDKEAYGLSDPLPTREPKSLLGGATNLPKQLLGDLPKKDSGKPNKNEKQIIVADRQERLEDVIKRINGDPVIDENFKAFVDSLARQLLDTNGDGQVNETDDNILDYAQIFGRNLHRFSFKYEGMGIIGEGHANMDSRMRSLLGLIFIWVARNYGDKDMPVQLGDDILVNFTVSDNGEQYMLNLSNGDWSIDITYTRPPGIERGKTVDIQKAFQELEGKKQRLSDIFTAEEEKATNATKLYKPEIIQRNEAALEVSSPKTSATKRHDPAEEKSRLDSILDGLRSAKKTESPAPKGLSGENILENQSIPALNEGGKFLYKEWTEDKTELMRLFGNILAEEAGAVYSTSDNSICAIILVKSSDTSDDEKDKEDEESK